MAGKDNLRVPSSDEARENGRKGGIASGESRRARKTLREELLLLLETDDNNKKISVALIEKALLGDINAFTTIRDTIGEKPVTEQKIEMEENSKLAYVLAQLNGNGLGDDD